MKKRKLFVSLLSAMAIASTTVLSAAAAHYKGDINRDDSVSVSDIVYIQKHLTGKSKIAADKLIYADLNDDGKVNIFDFVNAVRVVLGDAPLEEVPSLTTPAVTTTITTTTSTTVSTTSTTPVTSTTTTPKATTTTTATSTTTTPETTTIITTTATETSTTETTTVTETTVTSSETTSSATETEVSTEETTSATETTASETTTTAVETTTTASTSTTAGTTLIVNAETAIELDSTKELESMKLTVDTSNDYKLVFLFGDNWNTFIDLYCNDGVLTESHGSLIESVEIEDDVVTITFKSGLKVDSLTLHNNNSTITIYDYTVKYVGDETTYPVETTATTSATATNTTTTVATTTVTESETTKAPESSVTAETTTTVTTTDEAVTTTLILDENKTVELDATKTLDTMTLTVDTETNYSFNIQFGNWIGWLDITCNNGTLTTNFNGSNGVIEDVTIEDGTLVITFKEGTSVDSFTFNAHTNGTATITDYDIAYVGDAE